METLLRHWHMLRLLPRHPRKISTADLESALDSAGFPTSRRTIQRDLDKLSTEFPLVSDGNKPAGWSWQASAAAFDIPGMDTAAALTFQMVDTYLRRLLPQGCLQALQPHLARAEQLLEQLEGGGLKNWPDKVRIVQRTQSLQPPVIDAAVVDVVYEALFHDRQFLGCYHSRNDGTRREFVVNPLGLIFSDPLIYLVASLWDYPDVRLLALHRFDSARLLKDGCRRPAGFDLEAYLAQGGAEFVTTPMAGTLELQMLMTTAVAFHLRESPISTDQRITDGPTGWLYIRATVNDSQQLRWWLLGFADQVEVLQPQSLREEIAAKAQAMVQRYQGISSESPR